MWRKLRGSKKIRILVIILVLILLVCFGWRTWTNRHVEFNKQRFVYINDMPLPRLSSDYRLNYTQDSNSQPTQDFITHRSASEVLSDVSYLCKLYGFKLEPAETDQIGYSGATYAQTTIQCYKGNDGWQFDINNAAYDQGIGNATSSLPQSIRSNLSGYTELTIMSIGQALCAGSNVNFSGSGTCE